MYLYIPSKSDYLGREFYIEAWAGVCATRDKSHDLRFNDDGDRGRRDESVLREIGNWKQIISLVSVLRLGTEINVLCFAVASECKR